MNLPVDLSRLFRLNQPPPGSRPGTLVIADSAVVPRIRAIDYDADRVREVDVTDVETLQNYRDSEDTVSWVDVQGLGDEQLLRNLGRIFQLHPLAMEDVVNVPQRPKSEAYDAHHLVIGRMPIIRPSGETDREQISVLIGPGYVVTIQERYGDVFDSVRRRIREGHGPIRRSGPDYLAYALIDTAVDGYYPVLERLGDQLEDLEERVVTEATPDLLPQIFEIKHQLLGIRRSLWPQRESIQAIVREPSPFISDHARVYFQNTYHHCVQVVDVLETYRELAGSLLDVYLSSLSNRMNEIMKVLTIMASIFIPITFIAGVYGMNFTRMPELQASWGYPAALGLMAGIAGALLWQFRRRGWLGGKSPHRSGGGP